ncbi:hypothetical protein ACLB2K_049670 [Fragaria x ananassa]
MGIVVKAGDWAFKAFTAGLGVTTIYLTGTFSLNVYRGIAWHKAQPVQQPFSLSSSGFTSYFCDVIENCVLHPVNRIRKSSMRMNKPHNYEPSSWLGFYSLGMLQH